MGVVPRCNGCPFVTKCIGGKGPVDSPFVIVGESPGTNELRAGEPFVGESGKLLNEVLAAAGLKSLGIEPYVINALSCYPPPKAKAGMDGQKLMQTATGACQGRVIREITAHPRKVILCLGAAASWSVTNNFGLKITKERGQVLPSPYAEHGVVLAVHPAYLMRNGGGLPFWKKDVRRAVELLMGKGDPNEWRDPTWNVLTRPSQIWDLVEEYKGIGYKTADLETDRLHWFANTPSDPMVVPERGILEIGITHNGEHVDIIPEDVLYANLPAARVLFDDPNWAFHNRLFDMTWLNAPQHEIPLPGGHDTMLMSYSLNENRGFHDLDFVAAHWINAPRHKSMVDPYLPRKNASYRHIPTDVRHKYLAIDLKKQHLIAEPLLEAVHACPHANKLYYETLLPAVPEIVKIKLHGVEVDQPRVRENETELTKQIAFWADEINKYAIQHIGIPINPGSPQQLAGLLYDRLQLKIPGTRSTDEDTIIKIQRRYDHPICNAILNYRELIKRRGTYVTNLLQRKQGTKVYPGEGHIKPDGCVYPDFKLHGTTTGRLAGADPNLLNQPRGPLIRSQYKARKGKLFVEVDENQAELRSLAVMSGDALLMDIYTKNEVSIHDITTGKFYGTKQEMAASRLIMERAAELLSYFGDKEAHDWVCDKCDTPVEGGHIHMCAPRVYAEAKMRGKAVNFGIVYGREAYSLAMEFNISVHEAQRWIDEWMALYPGAASFIEWCRKKPAENRDLITMFGRKKRHGVVSREKLKALQNEAANFPHQSTASDIMLHTLIRCGPRLRSEWQAYPWNELYDAIYYEVDIDETKVAESIKFVQETVEQIPRDYGITRIPFLADAKIGFDWGHMKDWKGSIVATLGQEAVDMRLAA